MYTCAICNAKPCMNAEKEKYPNNCPSKEESVLEGIKDLYKEEENYKLSHDSAVVESEGYNSEGIAQKSRIEDTMDFANKCGYKNLGVAFCIGLSKEAKILNDILKDNGFKVNSISCKNGSIPKEFIGITEEEKIEPGKHEAMCNPIGQAKFLNKMNTEFNILVGLCVGHDSLFFKYAEAPTTVLIAKDRVLGHNPAAALYLSESYYKEKLYQEE